MTGEKKYPGLSKSRLVSAHFCLKRLYLERFHPELAEKSASTEAAFRKGTEVGALAQRLYSTDRAVEIAYRRDDMDAMVEETRKLIERGPEFPIFEATFRHQGVLVRVDLLLPDGEGWRAVEFKASTKVKPEHKVDCAVQWWVMKGVGLPINSIALGLVNSQFVYGGDGNYEGFIAETDMTENAEDLSESIHSLITDARVAITGDMPEVAVGTHCDKPRPYGCSFRSQCWPTGCKYPVSGIGGSKAKHAEWVNRGISELADIPVEEITDEKQLTIHHVTSEGVPELLDGAKKAIKALKYPRYYLDFETVGPAIPIWEGTRPYQAVPVQWSIHIDDGKGDGSLASMRHEEFLDLSGDPPMRALAERMIECLGGSGPVLMYTDYELRTINTLIGLFPDLTDPLKAIIDRLEDLHPIVHDYYYHPSMLGSWSIKDVAPAINPDMDYKNLEGINVGTAASEGYLEAINPETTPERKAELEEQLLRYCRFDTEAMVEIVAFLSG